MAKSKYLILRGGFSGGRCIVGVWIIIHSVTCSSVITECLVQIIIHSEDKEFSRDGDPSRNIIRTSKLIQDKKGSAKVALKFV